MITFPWEITALALALGTLLFGVVTTDQVIKLKMGINTVSLHEFWLLMLVALFHSVSVVITGIRGEVDPLIIVIVIVLLNWCGSLLFLQWYKRFDPRLVGGFFLATIVITFAIVR